jgi:hypothetical protein
VRITFEGRDWELDTAHVRLQHAMTIQLYTGLSIGDWEDSLLFKADKDGNIANPPAEWLKSIAALYWLMLAQNGEKVPIAEVDLDFSEFYVVFLKAIAAEIERSQAEAAAKPDPTSPLPSPRSEVPSPAPPTPMATIPMLPAPPQGGPATGF